MRMAISVVTLRRGPVARSNSGPILSRTVAMALVLKILISAAFKTPGQPRRTASADVAMAQIMPLIFRAPDGLDGWLGSRLIPHRHRPRTELQPAYELQVDTLRQPGEQRRPMAR